MEGLRNALKGAATALETALQNGWEPTFTPERAAECADEMERSLARINQSVRAIKQHATPEGSTNA